MISAETAAGHRQLLRLFFPTNERQKLVQDVPLVLQVSQHSDSPMHALVVPALRTHGSPTEHLQLAALDHPTQYADHATILILQERAPRRGEDEQRSGGVPEDQHLHISVQFLTVFLVVFANHS